LDRGHSSLVKIPHDTAGDESSEQEGEWLLLGHPYHDKGNGGNGMGTGRGIRPPPMMQQPDTHHSDELVEMGPELGGHGGSLGVPVCKGGGGKGRAAKARLAVLEGRLAAVAARLASGKLSADERLRAATRQGEIAGRIETLKERLAHGQGKSGKGGKGLGKGKGGKGGTPRGHDGDL
jgi:hypothetical protein